MENDCEIYVDPEEDEVFFGCVSDREKTVSSKLVKPTGSSSDNDCKLSKVLDEVIILDDDEDQDEKSKNSLKNSELGSTQKETTSEALNSPIASPTSNNTSVDLDHNYSTPMKHKIDKSILATPKSVVKADKDGGFLKVLSEIALVKAEAEGDKTCKEDEDKENQISKIPEIKVTEATPEKGGVVSPQKNINMELRRFRIIYNSPRNEELESLKSEKNFLNKSFVEDKRKSIDLVDLNELGGEVKDAETKTIEKEEVTLDRKNSNSAEITQSESIPKLPKGLRFSKEARKIVEVLKKSSADDTLNFTIPEIDVEEDNSFLSPEPVPALEITVIANQNAAPTPEPIRLPVKSKTDVKRNGVAGVPSQSKLQPVRYFSERKLYNQTESEVKKKCVKKLPLEENKPEKGEKLVEPVSKIPVFGTKNSKIPLSQRVARPVTAKTTPSRTPVGKTFKNSKFNHIESPINAYIHNKPTSLVLNIKPELKKGNLNKMFKVDSNAGGDKNLEKQPPKLQNPKSAVRLPFVEYKSATPYKIEKRGESRLPRLAPTVMKLISSHSPKVVKHQGRFYLDSPRKGRPGDNTIVADQNEVSVVVSQPAQKSNTMK